jgi:hypothetical protein
MWDGTRTHVGKCCSTPGLSAFLRVAHATRESGHLGARFQKRTGARILPAEFRLCTAAAADTNPTQLNPWALSNGFCLDGCSGRTLWPPRVRQPISVHAPPPHFQGPIGEA